MRVLIVDDEEPARCRLEDLIARTPGACIVGVCEGGLQAIEAIQRTAPDLVLLDVRMPEVTGFDVLEAIGPEHMPIVIFVTAYDEYALRAFEHSAVDYLLKPFDDERFATALDRARKLCTLRDSGRLRDQLLTLLSYHDTSLSPPRASAHVEPHYASRIAIRDNDVVRLVDVSSLEYIQAQGPYAELHLAGECILHRERMHILEARLDPAQFCRIHRSTIVRLRSVTALEADGSGDHLVQLHSGASLRISRTRLAALQERLGLL